MLVLAAGLDQGDDSDRQVFGENTVHAAGDYAGADGDFVVVADILHVEQRLASAADGTLDARVGNHGADAGIAIGQQQD